MEELEPKRQWKALWEKYRYVLLVVGLGLVLMMIPVRSGAGSRQEPRPTQLPAEESLEQKLEQVLASIQGVGQVSVLLTESTGSETSFQTDVSSDQQSESLRQSADTVIVEDPSRQERDGAAGRSAGLPGGGGMLSGSRLGTGAAAGRGGGRLRDGIALRSNIRCENEMNGGIIL